jgi:DNA-binding GntR family transcriptional regulator
MQTSRGPVRDALKMLESEGLVVRYPHRGTFVARLTRDDAEEIYTLRVALEALAVEYVIKTATPEQIGKLDGYVDRMQAQVDEGYTQSESADLDLAFHHTLCQISNHQRLLAAWEALGPQIRMLLLSHRFRFPEDWEEVGVARHRKLVAALRQPDVQAAQDLLRYHLMSSYVGLLESFEQEETETEGQR